MRKNITVANLHAKSHPNNVTSQMFRLNYNTTFWKV